MLENLSLDHYLTLGCTNRTVFTHFFCNPRRNPAPRKRLPDERRENNKRMKPNQKIVRKIKTPELVPESCHGFRKKSEGTSPHPELHHAKHLPGRASPTKSTDAGRARCLVSSDYSVRKSFLSASPASLAGPSKNIFSSHQALSVLCKKSSK